MKLYELQQKLKEMTKPGREDYEVNIRLLMFSEELTDENKFDITEVLFNSRDCEVLIETDIPIDNLIDQIDALEAEKEELYEEISEAKDIIEELDNEI